jgi:hypothetical protein
MTFKGAAQALDAEDELRTAGIAVGLMGRPAELGADCGFCLRLSEDDLDRALAVLTAAGREWQGIWLDDPAGEPRFQSLAKAAPGAGGGGG